MKRIELAIDMSDMVSKARVNMPITFKDDKEAVRLLEQCGFTIGNRVIKYPDQNITLPTACVDAVNYLISEWKEQYMNDRKIYRSGMAYNTVWKQGIYCTMGKKEFKPCVKIEIEQKNIPFREIDELMIHLDNTFEDACIYLVNEIVRVFKLECYVRVEIGDEQFKGWADNG